jgi:pyruvate dehydrogenase E2 component (dihydrolipoamide acetyltransferase)
VSAEIYMPQLGLTMTEGKVVRWLKAAGDPVRKGEPVLEIETDKVTAEIEAPADGLLGPILVRAGASVPIGGILSHVLATEEQGSGGAGEQGSGGAEERRGVSLGDRSSGTLSPGEMKNLLPERIAATPRARRKASELGVNMAEVEPSGPGGRIVEADVRWHFDRTKDRQPQGEPLRISPLARRLAEDENVDLAQVRGSGPGGRIVEDDVRRTVDRLGAPGAPRPAQEPLVAPRPLQVPPPPRAPEVEPLSGIRRVVAERMTHSFTTAPHFYLSAEVEATALVRLREGLRPKVEAATGAKLTVTDILLKICAQALAEFPEVNVAWAEDVPGGGLVRRTEINVGLAVSLDAGLMVPVLHGADRLTLGEIARRRADLVDRARNGKLSLGELEGGTFTLSNLGMYGVDQFQAILNPPQSAILAVGRIKDRPVAVDGAVVVRPTMHLSLSVDHRALDGAQAARFLERVAQLIQEPYLLLE